MTATDTQVRILMRERRRGKTQEQAAAKANSICERFISSLRRECLDHILVLNQRHLNIITSDYVDYFNRNRPHQGLAQKIPIPPDDPPTSGEVIALPVLGGLRHHYRRAA